MAGLRVGDIIGSGRLNAFNALVCVLWSYETLFRYIKIVLMRIPIIGGILYNYMPIAVVVFLAVLSLREILSYLNGKDGIFGLLVMALSLATIIIDSKTTVKFNGLVSTLLFSCVPMYFIGKAFVLKHYKSDQLINTLTNLSVICVCASLAVWTIAGAGFEAEWMSSQFIPYIMLPHLLLIMLSLSKRVNLMRAFVLLIGVFYILMLGNRGSIVCLLVMALILVIKATSAFEAKRRILAVGGVSILVGAVWYTDLYDTILSSLYRFALNNGMSTRVFLFLQGDFSAVSLDSGRGDLQRALVQAIKENPLGYGLAGDRYLVGFYSHNVFLEILVEFGVFAGGAISILLLVKMFTSLRFASLEWDRLSYLWVFFCAGIVKLLISGSYLIEPYFWAFIGMMVAVHGIRRRPHRVKL